MDRDAGLNLAKKVAVTGAVVGAGVVGTGAVAVGTGVGVGISYVAPILGKWIFSYGVASEAGLSPAVVGIIASLSAVSTAALVFFTAAGLMLAWIIKKIVDFLLQKY